MLIVRAPLRISLGGGGTDIPSYYERFGGGFLVAAAIDKYVYISVHDNFEDTYLLKYSDIENVGSVNEIRHPLFRECIRLTNTAPGVEITSIADIPAGTGLGSSGSFAVALLRALNGRQRKLTNSVEVAEQACHIEMDVLGEPVGKQDQYIAALGGIRAIKFYPSGDVAAEDVPLSDSVLRDLEDNLLLFFTGYRRKASEELAPLGNSTEMMSQALKENLDRIRDIGEQSFDSLVAGNLELFARQMTEQWQLKIERAPSRIHKEIDSTIQGGLRNGALGGKLVGAGGGGFLAFFVADKKMLRKYMHEKGLKEINFQFDHHGVMQVS